MRRPSPPRVSIGLPVFDGANYLRESLDSLLAQTFTDFELVIVDNASTDSTGAIVREYAERDGRITYRRNASNIGGFRNHRLVFELAVAPYFMWAAHDDVRAPEYLERCVSLLDRDPAAVIGYTKNYNIDERGDIVSTGSERSLGDEEAASDRFARVIQLDHRLEPIMGLIRSAALRRVRLNGDYPDSDRVMLAELSLVGRFVRAPDCLFHRRDHELRSARKYPSRLARMEWISPNGETRVLLPHWRQFLEFHRAVRTSDLAWQERRRCYRHLLGWARSYGNRMAYDVTATVLHRAARLRSRVRRL